MIHIYSAIWLALLVISIVDGTSPLGIACAAIWFVSWVVGLWPLVHTNGN